MPSLIDRTKAQIVKFKVGDQVFVRPSRYKLGLNEWQPIHEYDEPMTVTEVRDHLGFPHYRVTADDGTEWLVSQLELATCSFSTLQK